MIMPDVFTKTKRSEVMSRIRGSGNKDTELALMTIFRRHGITGWRCRTMPDFIEALERIDEIDPKACRTWAVHNFSLAVAMQKYEDYYQRISGVRIGKRGWYDPGAYGLDPWFKRYPS